MQLQAERTIVIEAIDEHHCRHRLEGEVHTSKLFGIGKLAEHMVIDSTVKTVEQLPAITDRCRLQTWPWNTASDLQICCLLHGIAVFQDVTNWAADAELLHVRSIMGCFACSASAEPKHCMG